MPNIIPVPVTVSVGVPASVDEHGSTKNFGSFKLVPYATTRGGSLDISRWLLLTPEGDPEELEDVSIFTVMPRKLLWYVCQHTFETDREYVPLVITIDDEKWTFPMCARELEYEQVHYMIEVEGDWMKLTEIAISDIIGEEQFVFCEREVLPTIDFADPQAVFDEMS